MTLTTTLVDDPQGGQTVAARTGFRRIALTGSCTGPGGPK